MSRAEPGRGGGPRRGRRPRWRRARCHGAACRPIGARSTGPSPVPTRADGRWWWASTRADRGPPRSPAQAGTADPGTTCRPWGVSVRSRVHEYGGASATVRDGVLFYVDQEDQDWYRADPESPGRALRLTSTGGPEVRHADGSTTPDGRWLVSVEERVSGTSATHRVVAVPTDGSGEQVVLVDDGAFVAAARPSPDGRWLAWCTWDHPDMPWDATVLRVAPLTAREATIALGAPRDVAGGPGVSVGQPRWMADGGLVFVDDRVV